MVQGYRVSQALYVVAALRIPDLLEAGPQTAADLAAECGANPDRLRRVMRALAGEGVFAEDEDGHFAQTPFSGQLAGDSEERLMILGWRVLPETYGAFGDLLHAVRTGESAFEHAYGAPFYAYLKDHPDTARAYETAVESTVDSFDDIVNGYDFSGIESLVDVGGGQGTFLVALLRRYPGIKVTLFDQPDVVAGAPARLAGEGAAGRVNIVGGDVFAGVPPGADAYFTCTVLRCFENDRCLRLLQNIRRAMAHGSRLVAVEQEIPSGPGRRPYGFLDLHAMVVYGSRDRTADEYRELYGDAGLELTRVIPVGGPFSAFEGRPR
jgi:SAM-dependent methyltransferase